MFGLVALLRSFGVNISDEHIHAIEETLPRLPAMVKNAGELIHSSIAHFETRFNVLEANQCLILNELQRLHGDVPVETAVTEVIKTRLGETDGNHSDNAARS